MDTLIAGTLVEGNSYGQFRSTMISAAILLHGSGNQRRQGLISGCLSKSYGQAMESVPEVRQVGFDQSKIRSDYEG